MKQTCRVSEKNTKLHTWKIWCRWCQGMQFSLWCTKKCIILNTNK